MTQHFESVERDLLRLLDLSSDSFSTSERDEVTHFIDVGEYGLALETYVGIVSEEDKRISNEAYAVACGLAKAMEFEADIVENHLKPRISPN